jgi:hypothetical protein
MVLFWLGYDSLRLISDGLLSRAAVEAPFRWEERLFLAPDGTIWPFYLARWSAAHPTGIGPTLLRTYCNLVYLTQIIGMPIILMVLWLREERHLFRRLVWSLTALHLLTLALYIAYPAAPPWWVFENGFAPPTPEHSRPARIEKGSVLEGLFHFSPNRFAAIPSLHAAYPLLLTLVLGMHGTAWPRILLAGAYAASMWFACVFLNQHYIVDLLIGAALAAAALPVAARCGHTQGDR